MGKFLGGGGDKGAAETQRQQRELIAKQEAELARREADQERREAAERDAGQRRMRGYASLLSGGFSGYDEDKGRRKLGTQRA